MRTALKRELDEIAETSMHVYRVIHLSQKLEKAKRRYLEARKGAHCSPSEYAAAGVAAAEYIAITKELREARGER